MIYDLRLLTLKLYDLEVKNKLNPISLEWMRGVLNALEIKKYKVIYNFKKRSLIIYLPESEMEIIEFHNRDHTFFLRAIIEMNKSAIGWQFHIIYKKLKPWHCIFNEKQFITRL